MSNYVTTTGNFLWQHFPGRATYVRDGLDDLPLHRLQLEGLLKSGDYLGTLATMLDNLSELLQAENDPERQRLQQIINDLLYIEKNYSLIKKKDA